MVVILSILYLLIDNFVNCCMFYSEENKEESTGNFELNEQDAGYEKAELDLIRNSLKRSYDERFKIMMSLIM